MRIDPVTERHNGHFSALSDNDAHVGHETCNRHGRSSDLKRGKRGRERFDLLTVGGKGVSRQAKTEHFPFLGKAFFFIPFFCRAPTDDAFRLAEGIGKKASLTGARGYGLSGKNSLLGIGKKLAAVLIHGVESPGSCHLFDGLFIDARHARSQIENVDKGTVHAAFIKDVFDDLLTDAFDGP